MGLSARRLISITLANRRIAAVSARICSLRMCRIAVGAWQLEERARLAIRLCGFGALPLGDNFFQLRAKLGALRVSQIDLSAQLIQLLGMFCAQLITAAAIIVS